jgi:UDP-MurNAc hydroxylase
LRELFRKHGENIEVTLHGDPIYTSAAQRKRDQFLNQAVRFVELLRPAKYAPFAGTYVLGSRLSALTEYRGVPGVSEAINYIDSQTHYKYSGILLEKHDSYDTKTGHLSKGSNLDGPSWPEYLDRISALPLDYDTDVWSEEELAEILGRAYIRFREKSNEIRFESNTQIIVNSEKTRFSFSRAHAPIFLGKEEFLPGGFVEISVDHNLLHRLLRGPKYAHWNNAEIGSHLRYVRKPDVFERGLYHALCFFHA